jgi:hypothetical protein
MSLAVYVRLPALSTTLFVRHRASRARLCQSTGRAITLAPPTLFLRHPLGQDLHMKEEVTGCPTQQRFDGSW